MLLKETTGIGNLILSPLYTLHNVTDLLFSHTAVCTWSFKLCGSNGTSSTCIGCADAYEGRAYSSLSQSREVRFSITGCLCCMVLLVFSGAMMMVAVHEFADKVCKVFIFLIHTIQSL
jgi:hypothetical protein